MQGQSDQTKVEFAKESNKQKLQYIQCDKSGFHYGQVLNMVCTQTSCLEDLLCCCACIQQTHKKHLTKPLKMVLREVKQHASKIKPVSFNIDVIIDILHGSQKQVLINFNNLKKEIIENLNNIEKSLNSYYASITELVKLKNSDPKAQFNNAYEAIHKPTTSENFKSAVKKLAAMVPKQDQEQFDLSQAQLIDSMNSSNDEIKVMVSKNIEQINKKLIECNETLTKSINNKNIWTKVMYKFSSKLKHNDVKLINDLTVKSMNSSGYKFAVMQPNLQKGNKIKTFSFKIKQSTSNWVAVGVCHRKIVESKNYAFNFSSLGHGGYLVSANGGSWSNTKSEANNTVKAFKFSKNDIITCTMNLQTKKITFKKKFETYELTFEKIPGDQLHPCALFYYMNDQVEFLQNYKPQ